MKIELVGILTDGGVCECVESCERQNVCGLRITSADLFFQKRWTKPLQEELLRVFVFQYFHNLFPNPNPPPSPSELSTTTKRNQKKSNIVVQVCYIIKYVTLSNEIKRKNFRSDISNQKKKFTKHKIGGGNRLWRRLPYQTLLWEPAVEEGAAAAAVRTVVEEGAAAVKGVKTGALLW
ncbi:hypothetical protein E3N88_10864 [Mikania micrantha]|uniref:Uncharacterized protein n=1 Tax=Mikania micrantha TaxID=192012 RepID=A0A5N6PC40_9ASTR|nr:hypothetical protein E3N88_10864 [Mikania micrantha]